MDCALEEKSHHHKTKMYNYVWRRMLTGLAMMIILQNTHMLNHYIIPLNQIQSYSQLYLGFLGFFKAGFPSLT